MRLTPIGGCSSVSMAIDWYFLSKEAGLKELKENLKLHRVIFACINSKQDHDTAGEVIRACGGYVIERFTPLYNEYMVVYAIPGTGKVKEGKLEQHDKVDQSKLAMAKEKSPENSEKKAAKPRTNWKEKFLKLKEKIKNK